MATIGKDPNGTRRILFVAGDGTRKTIRLGKVTMKVANEVKVRVEALNVAKIHGVSPDAETAAWLVKVGDDLAAKFAAAGLIPERVRPEATTLGGLIGHVTGLRTDAKPRTLTNLK